MPLTVAKTSQLLNTVFFMGASSFFKGPPRMAPLAEPKRPTWQCSDPVSIRSSSKNELSRYKMGFHLVLLTSTPVWHQNTFSFGAFHNKWSIFNHFGDLRGPQGTIIRRPVIFDENMSFLAKHALIDTHFPPGVRLEPQDYQKHLKKCFPCSFPQKRVQYACPQTSPIFISS